MFNNLSNRLKSSRHQKQLRIAIFFLLTVALSFFPITVSHADVVYAESTFDSDLDGWTFYDPIGAPDLSWQPVDGNPGGYLRFDDMSNGAGWVNAPAKFHGNWSSLDGTGRFEIDQTLFETGDNIDFFNPHIVSIAGPGGGMDWIGPTPTGPTPWEGFSIPISEANWTISSGDWNAILADVTNVWVLVELVGQTTNNGLRDSSGLDNVRLVNVPEPQSGLLIISCLVGAVGFCRRRANLPKHTT